MGPRRRVLGAVGGQGRPALAGLPVRLITCGGQFDVLGRGHAS